MNKFFLVSVIGFSLSVLVACDAGMSPNKTEGRLRVVATTSQVADMVQNIGGDTVDVDFLMGPGVDPHLYNPSSLDVQKLANADVVVYSGIHLEGKMMDSLAALEKRGVKMFSMGDSLDENDLIGRDPHIWFDPKLWLLAGENLTEFMAELDKEGAELYRQNFQNYRQEVENLLMELRDSVLSLPKERRILVTAHDAFAYFGRFFGFEVYGIQGISTESDYGIEDLEKLVELIVEKQVPVIFVESSVGKRSVEALKQGVLAEGFAVEIGPELYSDAMGVLGSGQETYMGMLKYNVNSIVSSLL